MKSESKHTAEVLALRAVLAILVSDVGNLQVGSIEDSQAALTRCKDIIRAALESK